MIRSDYRGRFAPSPTGPLHSGSLTAAVGSYLDAKHRQGTWLVRMEDLDAPRCIAGAADDILRTLEACGLHWDSEVMYQSQRTPAYAAALRRLQDIGAVYPCCCTRKEIADSALHGIEGFVYPGTCRNGMHPHPNPDKTTSHSTKPASGQVAAYLPKGEGMTTQRATAWRVRTDIDISRHSGAGRNPAIQNALCSNPLDSRLRGNDEANNADAVIAFDDNIQGRISQNLERDIGDFVVRRADGLFAYQLAVVVDDAFQGITHVVRGADLLLSTPRQIYLQRLLGLPTPTYLHLPIVVNAQGEKLSKQTLATPVDKHNSVATLFDALVFLRQQPPADLRANRVEEILAWAVAQWRPDRILDGVRDEAHVKKSI